MTGATGLNWATLWAYTLLMALCVIVGWRRDQLKAWALVAFVWAADNWLLYVMVLFAPDWVTPGRFAVWSAASKLHAVSSVAIGLVWASWREAR